MWMQQWEIEELMGLVKILVLAAVLVACVMFLPL